MSCSYSNISIALYDERAIDHPFKPLETFFLMMWLHYGHTVMKMQMIIKIISTPLIHQVIRHLLCRLKIKMASKIYALGSN